MYCILNSSVTLRHYISMVFCLSIGLPYFLVSQEETTDSLIIVYNTFSEADTAKVYSYSYSNRVQKFYESKERYITDFDFVEIRQNGLPKTQLSNIGSPVRRLFYDPVLNIDLIQNPSPFHDYILRTDEFEWLESSVDYSRVYFNQRLGEQTDLNVGARACKNWSDNMDMTVYFDRMSQATGLYQHQATRNTRFGMGLRYQAPNGKYQVSGLFLSNKLQQEFNQGIDPRAEDLDESGRIMQKEVELEFDVHSTSAAGIYRNNSIALRQSYQLRNKDRIGAWSGLIFHRAELNNRLDHFYDNNVGSAQSVYDLYYLDSRAIRYRFQQTTLSNKVGFGFTIQNRHRLLTGAETRNYFWNNDLNDFSDFELRIWGNLSGPLGQKGSYKATTSIPVINNLGKLFVDISANPYFAGDALSLEAHYELNISPPAVIMNEAIISQRPLYSNDFSSILHQKIGGELNFKRWLRLGLDFINLENPIYLNNNALPVQENGNYSILQGVAGLNIHWGQLTLSPKLYYQNIPSFYHLPDWITEVSMVYHFPLFKKSLEFYIGTDARYYNRFRPDQFIASTGLFALQDEYLSPEYPLLDAYLGFHASGLRVYLRYDNALPVFDSSLPMAELVYRQAQFSGYLRLGLDWSLFN